MFAEEQPEWKDRIMLLDDTGRKITYGELNEFCLKTGKYMEKRKLLFLLCENCTGSVETYFSCLRNGIVPLLLDGRMPESGLLELQQMYAPDYIAAAKGQEKKLRELFPKAGLLWEEQEFVCFDFAVNGTELYEDLALLLTTSGSTGSPKLVRLSYRNLSSNAASIASYLELTRTERPVTTLPMNYTYGLSVLNSHVLVGAEILLTAKTLFDREFWDFARRERATSLSGVPYTYQMLEKLDFFHMDLPDLTTMTQAGGKLPLELHRKFAGFAEETGKKFIVMYGQTEATARMGYLPAQYACEKCGSMGVAIPGGKFSLTKEGELVYEGKNVMLGYASCKEDLKKGDEKKGCLFTGDMAKRDGDGFYYITGRKSRFLKLFGKRIGMDETEELLRQRFKDVQFACTGTDDEMQIYMADGQGLREQVLIFLEEKTGINRRGFSVSEIGQIPKNEAGKVMYKELKNKMRYTVNTEI